MTETEKPFGHEYKIEYHPLQELEADLYATAQLAFLAPTVSDQELTLLQKIQSYKDHPDKYIRQLVDGVAHQRFCSIGFYQRHEPTEQTIGRKRKKDRVGFKQYDSWLGSEIAILSIWMAGEQQIDNEKWFSPQEIGDQLFFLTGSNGSAANLIEGLAEQYVLPKAEERDFHFYPLLDQNEQGVRLSTEGLKALAPHLPALRMLFLPQEDNTLNEALVRMNDVKKFLERNRERLGTIIDKVPENMYTEEPVRFSISELFNILNTVFVEDAEGWSPYKVGDPPVRNDPRHLILFENEVLYDFHKDDSKKEDYSSSQGKLYAYQLPFPAQTPIATAWGTVLRGPEVGMMDFSHNGRSALHLKAQGLFARELVPFINDPKLTELTISQHDIELAFQLHGFSVSIHYKQELGENPDTGKQSAIADTVATIEVPELKKEDKWTEHREIPCDNEASVSIEYKGIVYTVRISKSEGIATIRFNGDNWEEIIVVPEQIDLQPFLDQTMESVTDTFTRITDPERATPVRRLSLVEQQAFDTLGRVGTAEDLTTYDSQVFSPERMQRMKLLQFQIALQEDPLVRRAALTYCYERTNPNPDDDSDFGSSLDFWDEGDEIDYKGLDDLGIEIRKFFKLHDYLIPEDLFRLCEEVFPVDLQ